MCVKEVGRGFTYRCKDCDFKMDVACAKLQPEIQLSIHPEHPLTLQTVLECFLTRSKLNMSAMSIRCYLHRSCSIDLIEHYRDNYKQIQNSFHEHPLEIVYYSGAVAVCCSVCGKRCLGPTYVCFLCRFELHESCLGLVRRINQKSFHKHPLVMIEKNVNYSATCSACGEPLLGPNLYLLDMQVLFLTDHVLVCRKEIQHSFHPCPLTLRQETTKFTCRACGKIRTQFAFHCDRCHFYLDVECAQMFTGIFEDQKYILNPSHGHPLTLCNKEQSGDVVFCYGCSKTSSGQEIYGCVKCDFYLHRSSNATSSSINIVLNLQKSCKILFTCVIVKLVSQEKLIIQGHLHVMLVTIVALVFPIDVMDARVLGVKKFLKPLVKYKGHKHLLTFLEKIYDDPECEVCKTSYRDASYLRCVECDFNVHFLCVPLPCTIKHKCHIDPLHLRDYFVEDDSGEYYCDACEESRDPGECVYHCAECGNYVAHLKCVLDEVLLSLGEKRGDVEFRIVDRKMVNKLRGLTLENIFNSSNEDDQKEFEGVEVAISDLIRERMSRAEVMINRNHFLDNVDCSDETFIPVLKNVSFGDNNYKIEEFSGMTFWELDSEVVKVEHYMVSHNFVPILKSIFNKHGDICAKSTLKRGTKTRFLNMFCGVVYSMCNTMAKDINRNLLLNWWKNFKLVEHVRVQYSVCL
uniref:Zinc finger PHD-type domain-containing protein n=1 Tax=Fagus sylvatica TaxID=28930 RepID=A0A2N9IJN0_FAGSY